MKKIKALLLLSVFIISTFNVFSQNTSLINSCNDFVSGSNSIGHTSWSQQLPILEPLVKQLKHLPLMSRTLQMEVVLELQKPQPMETGSLDPQYQ